MSITIGGWFLIGIVFIVGIILSIGFFIDENVVAGVVCIFVTIALTIGLIVFVNWINTHTANGIRSYRTYQSNIKNGIERTIDIYNADGELRYHYEGTVDVDDSGEYELFFDTQDGQRVIVHYGVQDLVIIQSKGGTE